MPQKRNFDDVLTNNDNHNNEIQKNERDLRAFKRAKYGHSSNIHKLRKKKNDLLYNKHKNFSNDFVEDNLEKKNDFIILDDNDNTIFNFLDLVDFNPSSDTNLFSNINSDKKLNFKPISLHDIKEFLDKIIDNDNNNEINFLVDYSINSDENNYSTELVDFLEETNNDTVELKENLPEPSNLVRTFSDLSEPGNLNRSFSFYS